MKSIINLFLFFVPYWIHVKTKRENGVATFVHCVLLVTANVVSAIILYLLITDSYWAISEMSRGRAKLFGLLSLVPFALFYGIFKNTYKRKFSEFDDLDEGKKQKMSLQARRYVVGSIILFALCTVVPMIWKWYKSVHP